MEHYETSFFVHQTQPTAKINRFTGFNVLSINNSYSGSDPKVTFYFDDESKLIEFVNSVKSAYNRYRKEKGYDRRE